MLRQSIELEDEEIIVDHYAEDPQDMDKALKVNKLVSAQVAGGLLLGSVCVCLRSSCPPCQY